jgi:hypothetical protein
MKPGMSKFAICYIAEDPNGITRLAAVRDTKAKAKRYLGSKALRRNWGRNMAEKFEVKPLEEYREIAEILVPSQNIMSGKAIKISRDSLGTCCDPATETYWSM